MADINRNGKAYDSADVRVQINGIPINVKSISYGNEQEHQLNHTLGAEPTSWSMGKITPSASMTVPMHEIAPLERVSGGLLKIKPFTITVEFVNEFNEIVVDKIVAKFKNEGREVTGDMGLEKQYDLFALSVKLRVA
ncbi:MULTISPECIES: hypothetical protein [Capnocytophaga]|jgi:hypothetical protein|uniref:Phage tail protein n=1 Tax=Capnocytophaga sputigena TaxID=1019 RepID=A0A250F5B4_CAPSP|nr:MULTISPECIES: hypothetical protein [Capnocytophaga]DAM98472.1 MAG TPA: Protein of unknown function (DUF2597) [Caudoviricetes sp.]ATA80349.1 hypothetical protein CGC59_11980 [Capnocytophaga sputigena]DAP05866.1 MAG TPA: Protein of unknown function (DUF2597) [Caudoviricetes sp.]DAP72303.1 MAG TPA: Protein of unknown function (DUF2597) [Caudoviricetes sp.]DAP97155.1 MAG TPA: Protein of unknown function (DUF2597) [Caudoviricetes sp.]